MVLIKVWCIEWADLDKLYYIESIPQQQVSCRPGMLPRCPRLVLQQTGAKDSNRGPAGTCVHDPASLYAYSSFV